MATGQLMFEVGVSENVKNLEKVKEQLNSLVENYSKNKAIQLKVNIENLDTITTALSKIGDSPKLRELRQEIESLNREFSKLAAGAGGVGDLNLRAANQNVAELKENWQSANRTLLRYKTDLEDLRRTRDMQPVGSQARTDYQGQIATFKKTVEEQQKIADAAKSAYDKAVKDAGQLVDANTRAEASYRELKSSIDGLKTSSNGNVVGTDFSNWAKEVQNVTASVRELVEQLQKMHTATATSAKEGLEPLLSQAQVIEGLKNKYNELLKKKADSAGIMPTIGIDRELKDLEQKLPSAQAKFNESLEKGASVANSYSQSIQQLGQKYNHTGEQAQKLAEIIASGQLSTGNVQRGLKVGFNQATDIVNTIEALQKLKQEESKPAPQGGLFDPQKFSTLQEAIDKIISEINRLQQAFTRLGENSSLSNLSTMINGLAVTLSSLSNAIKIQPLDEQVKALLDRCEKAEAKLREVGDAAKYLNERAGAKTQQKAGTIMDITGTEAEQLNKVSSTAERFMRLLVEIENQMAKIGKIQAFGEQSGFSPTLLKNAQNQLEALHKMVQSTFKGTPVAEGLIIPASDSQLAQFIQQFGLLKAQYRDIITEADKFNKVNERADLKKKSEDMRAAASNMKEAANESRRLTETISNLEALASKAGALGIDTSKLRNVIDNLKGLRSLMDDVAKTNSHSTKDLKLEERFFQLKRDIKDVAKEIKKEMSAALKPDTEQANAFKEYISLLKQITSLTGTAKRADALGIDTQTLRNQIALLENYAKIIERFVGNKGVGFNAWMQATPVYGEARGNIAADQAKMNKEIADAKHANSIATAQLTESERRFVDAIRQSTDSMKGQSQVLSDLKMLATQYLSVWGAQSFINNIIQTGGLLEQQRLSIGAILQNAGQATELFGKIKALAIQSPFGVVELDRMSKQLTAYGFEYKELYDWTKRLGDISAATGTGVDRLALALGHVRSEGALSGYTLRQFAMGNVPVLRMLSENLGISTKQVREKVRKKEISYEDVQDVLRQLTDEGGMFYKAQETMSQALNAKFKNLHDAFDIMYGEIAESGVGNALKKIAETLTAGAKEWGRYAKDLMGVAAAFGIAKSAMLAYNVTQARGLNTSLNSIATAAKQERENLRLAATYRELTAEETAALGPKSALTRAWYSLFAPMKLVSKEQLANAISAKKLTQEELLRAVALRKVNIEQAKAAVLASKLSRAQKANMIGALNNVTVLGKWRIALLGLGNAMKGVLSIAKTFAPLAAISVIMDMFARVSEMKDKAKEASADLAEKATSDLKVLGETFKELQDNGFIKSINSVSDKFINGKRVVSNVIQFDDSALNGKDLTQEINELKAKLQDMSPIYEGDLVDIDKMDNQVEQFKLIVKKLESIRHANDVTEAMSDIVTQADVDVSGRHWWTQLFGDSYTTDVKDYENRLKDAEKSINDINEQTIENIDKELDGQLEQLRKKYSLSSKNNALYMLYSDWSKKGVPQKYRGSSKTVFYFDESMRSGMRSVRDQYKQLESDTEEMAQTLSSIIVNEFINDPEGGIYAISTYINKLMAMAGITDPRVINEATAMMLDAIRNNLPKELQTGVVDEMQRRILMEQFMGFIGNTITESTTPEEAEKALKKYSEMTIKWGVQMGYDLKKIGMDNAEAYRDGLEAKMNSVEIKVDWQKRASEVFVVNTVLKTNIDKSLDEFAQAVQKDLKAKQDYLARNKHHLKMTLNIDTDILMNADKLKVFMDKLAEQGQKKAMAGDWEGAKAIYSKIDSELKPYYDALMSVKEDKEWLKKEGYPETDQTKGNKKDPNTERAKAVREQVRVIKEAADAFQYWREKVGDKGAWEHVQKEFGDVLQKIGITATNIEDVREHLKKIPQTKEYQAITDKKVKTEIDKEIAKENDQYIRKDFERDTERFLSKTQIELDNLTRSWEIFNSVREATGNVKLAIDLSSAQYAEGQTRNLADAIKQKLEQDFAESGAAEIPFDINLDDEKIKDRIQKAIPQANEQKIKGFVEQYKKWRDLQRDVMKNDINTFAKLIGGLQDYGTQVGLVNIELELQKESLKKLRDEGKLTQEQYEKALKAAEQLAESKKFKMSAEYSNLMNHYLGLTNEQIKTASMAVQNDLNNSLKAGTITAEQYAEEMAKIEEIALKVKQTGLFGNNGSFATFIKGGMQGLQTKYTNSLAARRTELAQQGKSAEEIEKDEQVKKYKKISESLGDFQNVLNNAAATFTMVIGILNGLADAAQMLSDMFDATGNENLSNTWSDIGDSIGAVTSGLNSAVSAVTSAAQGNIGGVITGVVGIFTSPITAFAKLYDKRRQREIDAIKEQVKAINENTDAIKTYRNRTLGYDTNELRRLVGLQYRTAGFNMFGDNNPARVAMKEYYNTNTRGSGYAVELANLKEERKKIIEMYNIEEDKKKSSKDALNEYKQQIAELDEQILFYAEDFANELWGIDFKSWSSQISDAIWTAFENGEDAMEAFHDTAKDIISDVAKRMMNIHLIEPVFKALEDELFGKIDANGNRVGGAYNAQTGQFNENMTLEILGRFFGESGEFAKALDSAEKFYEMAERITGFDFSSDDDSSSSSKSIKGITEQTADLLAAYLNAVRLDVSVIRAMDAKVLQEYWPSQIRLMTAGTQSLTNIEQHTLAIMRSSDAIERSNQAILDNINGLKSKTWSLPVA